MYILAVFTLIVRGLTSVGLCSKSARAIFGDFFTPTQQYSVKYISALALWAAPLLASAQVTISQAQFPLTAASVGRFQPARLMGATTPTTGPNQTWDYRALVAQGGVVTSQPYNPPPANPPFPGTVRTYDFVSQLGPFAVSVTAHEGFDADGFGQLGSTIPAQTFPLPTGGAADVLNVPAQSVAVNTLEIPLPMSASTYVVRSFRVRNNTTLTIAALGLTNAPFQYVQRTLTVDSVAGWGTVQIPVAGSPGGSAPIDVLLVRRRYVQQDSFYVAGQPAPAALLGALGQTQGRITRVFRAAMFRPNATQSVLSMIFGNGRFTAPTSVSYSAEMGLPVGVGRELPLAEGGLRVWPNPAAAGAVRGFEVPGAAPAEPLRLTLRDAAGRTVARATVPNGQPAAALPGVPAGLYFVEAETAAGQRAARRVVVE